MIVLTWSHSMELFPARQSMGTPPESVSNSSKMSKSHEENSDVDASSDCQKEHIPNSSSEESSDFEEDFRFAAGGFRVLDMETAPALTVRKVYEGIEAAIHDFNRRNGSNYKFVAIEEVQQVLTLGFSFHIFFSAKPEDSNDDLLTVFIASMWFPLYDKLKYLECKIKSSE